MTLPRSWGIVSSGPISESWKDFEPPRTQTAIHPRQTSPPLRVIHCGRQTAPTCQTSDEYLNRADPRFFAIQSPSSRFRPPGTAAGGQGRL